MGNPHCVLLVDDVDQAPVPTLGPHRNPRRLSRSVNVEFVQVVDPANVRMRVWERGSGETYACGTGACAAVVATSLSTSRAAGHRPHLGRRLEIEWASDGHVYMLRPVRGRLHGRVKRRMAPGVTATPRPVPPRTRPALGRQLASQQFAS